MSEPGKAELRSRIRARLAALDPASRSVESGRIRERLKDLDAWRVAQTVLLFSPLRDEPDLWPLVDEALVSGRRLALPVFDAASGTYAARQIIHPEHDLVSGRFGVREPGPGCPPVSLAALDLIVLPGLAFTKEGSRLGRGGGFYDRLLQASPAVRCGVGRDEQLLVHLPTEPHDVQLDFVLTPSCTHRCHGLPD